MTPGGSLAKVISVEYRALAHATESPDKIEAAILNILPIEMRSLDSVSKCYLKGHYGNPIVILTLKIAREKAAKAATEYLFKLMSQSDRRELDLEFEKSLDDEKNFYIRLGKQEAFKGKIVLSYEDPIRVRIKIKIWQHAQQGEREFFKNLGMVK